MNAPLDTLDHLAIPVKDVAESLAWYQKNFQCRLLYKDDTWALVEFANIRLAFVMPGQHPGHLSVARTDAEKFGTLKPHRDGTRSVYIQDPAGNHVEILKKE